MKSYVSKFAMFVALSCGFALAQSMPQQQTPQSSPATPSASQPADQTQPAAQPDQSVDQGKNPANAPENMPKTDQDKSKSDQDKSADQSKLPQSDASAAAGGDVSNQIQTAIQQDPKLANANITVEVKGKNLELNGTVPSGDEKKQAEKIAKSNAGGLKVKNHIKVASNSMPDKDKDKTPGANPKQ